MVVEIERIGPVTPEVAEAFARLVPQLSPTLRIPSREELQTVADSGRTALFCARHESRITGVLTLAWYDVPSGRKAWIEDVVVDTAARGSGTGEALVRAAVAYASEIGAARVMLYSSPTRHAAHALYHKTGFEETESTLFRLIIGK